MRVVVVGATGAVGTEILSILEARRFPLDELVPVASARSAGRKLSFAETTVEVAGLTEDVFEGSDIALFDVPDDVAESWAPIAAERGAVVVDNSAAWRMHREVPLIVPEINPEAARSRPRNIIASPNCTTLAMIVPLAVLHREAGLERVVLASYQSASGAGRPGVDELWDQLELVAKERDQVVAGRAREVLGWTPRLPALRDIVASAWRWHQAHPDGYANCSCRSLPTRRPTEDRSVILQVRGAIPTTPWELVLASSTETQIVLVILAVFSLASW
ncbi:MAG: aspartate-semialdehyde dehydrogenase, partial [Actinomycetota bacterium]